jgi:hypothetical protein
MLLDVQLGRDGLGCGVANVTMASMSRCFLAKGDTAVKEQVRGARRGPLDVATRAVAQVGTRLGELQRPTRGRSVDDQGSVS